MFSLLNGFSGYNEVLVTPLDQIKTTFRTPWGTFPYKIIPFVLTNAGSKFQRDMDISFGGLMHNFVVVYLDDITIYSKKRHDHMFSLKHIF